MPGVVLDLRERLVLAVGDPKPLDLLLGLPLLAGPAVGGAVDVRVVHGDRVRGPVGVAVADLVARVKQRAAVGVHHLEVVAGLLPAVGRVNAAERVGRHGDHAVLDVPHLVRRHARIAQDADIAVRRAVDNHAERVFARRHRLAELVLAVPFARVLPGGQGLHRP